MYICPLPTETLGQCMIVLIWHIYEACNLVSYQHVQKYCEHPNIVFFQELRGAWSRNCRSGEDLTETGRPRQTQSALICVCHKCIMHMPMQSMPEMHDANLSGSANCQYANPYSFSFSILNPCTHMPMQCRHIWAYAYICILCNVFASKQIQMCISFLNYASTKMHLSIYAYKHIHTISMHIMQDKCVQTDASYKIHAKLNVCPQHISCHYLLYDAKKQKYSGQMWTLPFLKSILYYKRPFSRKFHTDTCKFLQNLFSV